MCEIKREGVSNDHREFLKVERGLSEKTIHQHATMLQVFLGRYEQVLPAQDLARGSDGRRVLEQPRQH